MKKFSLLCIAFAAVAAAQAQVRVGVQAGASLGTASFTKEADIRYNDKPVYGPTGGVVFEIPVTAHWSLRPSLNYLQKGIKSTATGTDVGVTGIVKSELRLHFVELPVFMTWNKELGGSKIFVGAGPSVGLGFKGKIKSASSISGIPESLFSFEADPFKKSADIDEPFKRFEVSAAAQAGIEFKNGIFLSANYIHGLNNISGSSQGDTYRNRTLSLSLGYFFRSSK